jgi:hypothetical protein
MLKRWRLAFNPDTEYFQHRHLWVLLPGLPLHLWNDESLKAIGNSIGQFISLDTQSQKSPSRKMGKILVAIDITAGLPAKLDIVWRGRVHQQTLDYLGLPFRCNICRETGHLRHSCPGKSSNLCSEEDELHLNPPDYTESDPSLAHLDSNLVSSPCSPTQNDNRLSKLKLLCPLLYRSLSVADKEAINNFSWLSPPLEAIHSRTSDPSPTLEPTVHSSHSSILPLGVSSLLPDSTADPSTGHSCSVPSEAKQDLPGYSQPEEEGTALLDALSLPLHSFTLPSHTTQLPTYRGKEVISETTGAGTSNSKLMDTKSFAWSRGLATELSPLQTRSSRKKKEAQGTQQMDSVLPSLDGKALRAMKALARSK